MAPLFCCLASLEVSSKVVPCLLFFLIDCSDYTGFLTFFSFRIHPVSFAATHARRQNVDGWCTLSHWATFTRSAPRRLFDMRRIPALGVESCTVRRRLSWQAQLFNIYSFGVDTAFLFDEKHRRTSCTKVDGQLRRESMASHAEHWRAVYADDFRKHCSFRVRYRRLPGPLVSASKTNCKESEAIDVSKVFQETRQRTCNPEQRWFTKLGNVNHLHLCTCTGN